MDRNLALEAVRVTEAAALASFQFFGCGDKFAADHAAAEAMRKALNSLNIEGSIVIGEGERSQTSTLYVGEKVGTGQGPQVDIALDALEGTESTVRGLSNSLSVIAFAAKGHFLQVPDVYMDKVAVGPSLPPEIVSVQEEPILNLRELARAKRVAVGELVVCILDRPRHKDLIAKVRSAGACIHLIPDGDISGILATAMPETGIDMYLGIGGALEGVLAAAALRCLGGQIYAQMLFQNEEEKHQASLLGIKELDKIYTLEELASGDVMFAATGVTTGTVLRGISRFPGGAHTHSLVMRSATGTVRFIQTRHSFMHKPRKQ